MQPCSLGSLGQATGLPGFLGQLNFDDDKRGLRTSAFRTLSVFGTLLGALARFGLFCTVVAWGVKFFVSIQLKFSVTSLCRDSALEKCFYDLNSNDF